MAKLNLPMAPTVDYSAEGWTEFVKWLDGTYAKLAYVWADEGPAYSIAAIDGMVYRTLGLNKADAGPFEAAWKTEVPTTIRTADGRPVAATNSYPSGTVLQVSGRADSRVNGRNKGQALFMANKAPGDYEIEWQYNDSVWLTGGGAFIHGSDDSNDHFTLDSYCPATPVVPNGEGTGNCNVVNGIIVPAAGDGAFDVDLATANPIPAPGGAGYWNWNQAIQGLGTITPSLPGEGNSLLIAVDVTLNVFAPEVHFVGSTQAPFVFPDVVASHLWPFWKVRLKLHVESAEVDFACHLILARYETT